MSFSAVDIALQHYLSGHFWSLHLAAAYYGIAKTTLVDCSHGWKCKQEDIDSCTRLTRGEEQSLAYYVRPQNTLYLTN